MRDNQPNKAVEVKGRYFNGLLGLLDGEMLVFLPVRDSQSRRIRNRAANAHRFEIDQTLLQTVMDV